jgi:hypothetical protein
MNTQAAVAYWEKGVSRPKADKKELLLKLLKPKEPEKHEEISHLKETIAHQKLIIESLQDKIKSLGGSW